MEPTVMTRPLPEAPAPPPRPAGRRPTIVILAIALALALVALLLGGWAYLRRGDEIRSLRARLDRIERVGTARGAALGELRGNLRAARARIDRLEDRLADEIGRRQAAESSLVGVAGPPLPDGRHFGYVRYLDLGGEIPRMLFDAAEWYVGDEADREAIEDGVIGPGERVENDIYIRNENALLRSIEVAGDARVLVVFLGRDPSQPTEIGLQRFARLIQDPSSRFAYARFLPFWATIEGGAVVEIEEQYVP
ncbi:MAG TPA: hypothetical protein VF097_00365 [Actinomycetota bacterium]